MNNQHITTFKGLGLGPFFFDPPATRPWKPEGTTIVAINPDTGHPETQHHNHRWQARPLLVTCEGARNPDEALAALERIRRQTIEALYEAAQREFTTPHIFEFMLIAQAMTGDKKRWVGELQTVLFAVGSKDEWELP